MTKTWKRVESVGREAADRLREALPERARRPRHEAEEPLFPALHWMTAALFASAGAQLLGRERAPAGTFRARTLLRDPLRLAPLVAVPLAGSAHVVRALTSEPRARLAAQILDGVAAGVAVAGVAQAAYNSAAPRPGGSGRPRWTPVRSARALAAAATPLAIAATAVLGLVLEHEEERRREEVERLERRARVVERLVPRRKARLDHIVVHV